MWTFLPIYKHPVWSGNRIPSFKNGPIEIPDNAPIGESWEVSDVPDNVSVVADGPDKGISLDMLIARYCEKLLGKGVMRRYGSRFPLLIKIIDAGRDLSIQVHPDDAMAQTMGHPFGKNEMWMVLEANQGARLASGFNREIDPAELNGLVESGKILDVLRYIPVEPGSAFHIPSGRVHAIGAGILIAEIQQTSDDTFRLYDYNRPGSDGKPRPLHLPQARKAINYGDVSGFALEYEKVSQGVSEIIDSDCFTVNMIAASESLTRDYSALDSFVAVMAIEGCAELEAPSGTLRLEQGNTVLLPATDHSLQITPCEKSSFRALEVYIR